jgi:hypothetical protein
MAAQPPIIFGRNKSNITPLPTSCRGMSGFWTVPNGWFMKPAIQYNPNAASSEMVASPNSDFSAPVYYCTLSDDGQTFCFYDQLLDTYART